MLYAINNNIINTNDNIYTNGLDDCNSPLISIVEDYFNDACAPPNNQTNIGICGICPILSSSSSLCNDANIYASAKGALRGLSEGLCDVAFVNEDTWNLACGDDNNKESWCLSSEYYSTITEADTSSTGFGKTPSGILVRNKDAFSSDVIDDLLTIFNDLSANITLTSIIHAVGISSLPIKVMIY